MPPPTMADGVRTVALYTTVYPGAEPYLPAWYASVQAQTDRRFDLWIGVDLLEPGAVERAMGSKVKATWVRGAPGDTPAQIRQRALARIAARYDAVVLVDSDDVLHPSRVAGARAALETSDLAACAMQLVDQQGDPLGITFTLPPGTTPDAVLPRTNVFGLSNTAFRSALLRRCLPIPTGAVLVDWFLATRAWLLGARLAFDPAVRMHYRQHAANTVRVCPPYTARQVARDAGLVQQHFRHVLGAGPEGGVPARWAHLESTAQDVDAFCERVVARPDRLARYVRQLNALEPAPVWWTWVAHPCWRAPVPSSTEVSS